jgi:nucleoside phosphorylase
MNHTPVSGGGMSRIDVLIVAALPEEYAAVISAARSGIAGHLGIAKWAENNRPATTPYVVGDYLLADGSRISVALARSTRKGAQSTAPVVASLAALLEPRCLAMCGICAGNPASISLGDVIIAEMVYAYDEGKQTAEGYVDGPAELRCGVRCGGQALALRTVGGGRPAPPSSRAVAVSSG